MILVAQDTEGLRQAALQLFESAMHRKQRDRMMANLADAELSEIERVSPQKTLSPGYADRVLYLLWLERMLAASVHLSLDADEAEGLRVIHEAREAFRRDHPDCPHCGAMLHSSTAKRCASCMKEVR